MKRIIFPVAILALSAVAIAHPHKSDETETKPKAERIWPNFGKKSDMRDADTKTDEKVVKKVIRMKRKGANLDDTMDAEEFGARLEKRFERHASDMDKKLDKAKIKNRFLKEDQDIETLEDIRDAAVALEDLLSDSGIISGLADMMLDFADDFEVESSDEGVSLNFEGKRLGRLKVDKDSDENFDIEGFGRNLSIDKKVIRKNGKTKTRIVIEMDGDEEFDIDLKPKR